MVRCSATNQGEVQEYTFWSFCGSSSICSNRLGTSYRVHVCVLSRAGERCVHFVLEIAVGFSFVLASGFQLPKDYAIKCHIL